MGKSKLLEFKNRIFVCGKIVAAYGVHAIALIREDSRHELLTCDGQDVTISGGVFAATDDADQS